MSIQMMVKVMEAEGFTPSQKAVLGALANHANEFGESIYPSVERMQIYTALAESTVRLTLAQLRKAEVIRVVKKANHYRPTEYAIDPEKLPRSSKLYDKRARPTATRGQPESDLRPSEARPPTIGGQGAPDLQPSEARPPVAGPKPLIQPSLNQPSLETVAPAATKAIQAQYEALLGYKLGKDWVKGESTAAKAMAARWTPAQLAEAYGHYKADPFWSDKRLSLAYLLKQMPEYFRNGARHNGASQQATKRDGSGGTSGQGGGDREVKSPARIIAERLSRGESVG